MNTHVSVVLDSSGSMQSIRESTVNGFNELLESLQREAPDASMALLPFATEPAERQFWNPITAAEPLTDKTYQPKGSTALYDALVQEIRAVEAIEDQPERVVFIIVTDGMENASRTETLESAKALIDWHTNEGKGWEFTFLGANIDSYATGGGLGIRAGSTMNYNASPIGTQTAWRGVTGQTVSYVTGAAATMDYDKKTRETVESTK